MPSRAKEKRLGVWDSRREEYNIWKNRKSKCLVKKKKTFAMSCRDKGIQRLFEQAGPAELPHSLPHLAHIFYSYLR